MGYSSTRLARIDVFGPVTIRKARGKTRIVQAAWQAHNPSRRMEKRMARLSGSGSFYWPSVRDALRRAQVILREDPSVQSARVETISGRSVAIVGRGYLYAP